MIIPSEHLEGFTLNLRYIHPYCFRNVIYLLCMKHDTYHMSREEQPNKSIKFHSVIRLKYGLFAGT